MTTKLGSLTVADAARRVKMIAAIATIVLLSSINIFVILQLHQQVKQLSQEAKELRGETQQLVADYGAQVGDIIIVKGQPFRIEYSVVGEYRLKKPIGKAPPRPYPSMPNPAE